MRLSIHKGSGADDVLHLSISVYTSLIWACAVCRTWPGRVSTKQSCNPIWAHCPRHIVRTRTIKMSPVQKRQHGELECRKAKSFSEVGCVWWRSWVSSLLITPAPHLSRLSRLMTQNIRGQTKGNVYCPASQSSCLEKQLDVFFEKWGLKGGAKDN